MQIYVNSIVYNKSISDGPGIRSVVYLQGCTRHCQGCHNKSTWATNCGLKYDVAKLAQELKENTLNQKITISGGEPLFQKKAVISLIKELKECNLCLYTSHNYDEVPIEILPYLNYLKVGKYEQKFRCTTIPYIGSTNQKFIELNKED